MCVGFVPFLDWQAQFRGIKPQIDGASVRVVESAQLALDPDDHDVAGEVPLCRRAAARVTSLPASMKTTTSYQIRFT